MDTTVARSLGWVLGAVVGLYLGIGRLLCAHVRGRLVAAPGDAHVEALRAARGWLGYVTVALVVVLSRDEVDTADLGTLLSDGTAGVLVAGVLKALVALPLLVVGALVVTLLHPRGTRSRHLARSLAGPVLVVAVACPPFVLPRVGEHLTSPTASPWLADAAVVAAVLALLVTPLWLAVCVTAIRWGVRHSFRAADVHPYLPSVIGAVVAVASSVEAFVSLLASSPGLERRVAMLAVGGVLLVLALACYEYARLRRHGCRWRPDVPAGS